MESSRAAARRWGAISLLVLVLVVGFVVSGHRDPAPSPPAARPASAGRPTPPGLWSVARDAEPETALASDETISALRSLSYLQGYEPAPPREGVTLYDPARAEDGVNLYTSGHAPEAFLMDMAGNLLHEWGLRPESVWPDAGAGAESSRYWRRVYAFENGDLLAIFDGAGLVKLDRGSRLLWAYRADCHHDLFVAPDDTIYVLTREQRVLPRVHPSRPSLEEFVTQLDADGRPLRRISLYAAFLRSNYASLLTRVARGGDIFHTNTLTILDGSLAARWPLFARGRALISLRNLDTVALMDLESEKVVWALTGLWLAQHEPSLLPSGRLLVFDNGGRVGRSRVVEIDPLTQQVAWQYPDPASDADLASTTSGSAARLANGNTLISESTGGRALEVTPSGDIVWEFWNPHRAGEKHELIATLLEVVRLSPGFGRRQGWVGAPAEAPVRQGRTPP